MGPTLKTNLESSVDIVVVSFFLGKVIIKDSHLGMELQKLVIVGDIQYRYQSVSMTH